MSTIDLVRAGCARSCVAKFLRAASASCCVTALARALLGVPKAVGIGVRRGDGADGGDGVGV
eukprot:SAG11_NODE_13087_length_670_cov_178.973730_2_plen_62_part_00